MRPPDLAKNTKPSSRLTAESCQAYSRGARVLVGGVADSVTEGRVRQHFATWGSVLDVHFPKALGRSRSDYCFVTFDNQLSALRACSESRRSLNGWVSSLFTPPCSLC